MIQSVAIFIPLQVIPFDQALDPLLEIRWFDGKLELIVQFCYQEIVCECLSRLHDPDDRRVYLVLPVLEHPLLCVYLLLMLQTETE